MKESHCFRILIVSVFLFSLVKAPAQNDIPIDPNYTWNGEISLAVDPLHTNHLVAAWMKLTGFVTVSIVVSYSDDDGASWSDPVVMPHFSGSYTSADPTLTFSSDGRFYLGYIDFNNITYNAGSVYVSASTDGGATWSAPVMAIDISVSADKPIDRPWLAVDNSGGSYHGSVYLVTKSIKEATAAHHIWMVKSTNNGNTWSTPVLLDSDLSVGATSNAMGVPCVTSAGILFVNYLSYDPTQSYYVRDVFVNSSDGGQTFSASVIADLPAASAIPPSDSLYQYSMHIAANPVLPDNLVHVFTDRRFGDWDILCNYSLDGGNTWSDPFRINDDPVNNGVGQDMCWGGFSNNGIYSVIWRDRRNGTIDPASDYRIYGSFSLNGGVTFNSNFALSTTPGGLSRPVSGNDFLGTVLSDSLVFSVWADKRTGLNQEYFNRYALPASSGSKDMFGQSSTRQLIAWQTSINCLQLNQIFISGKSGFKIEIFDLTGIMVFSDSNHIFLCPEFLPDGMYIIELKVAGRIYHQRILISN
ncbi:MAG: exo-alpha-sialidase [Bacteroidetes bacterium]|nr:exo-alpha-sialidase [Bacteroidota bacterium]